MTEMLEIKTVLVDILQIFLTSLKLLNIMRENLKKKPDSIYY